MDKLPEIKHILSYHICISSYILSYLILMHLCYKTVTYLTNNSKKRNYAIRHSTGHIIYIIT